MIFNHFKLIKKLLLIALLLTVVFNLSFAQRIIISQTTIIMPILNKNVVKAKRNAFKDAKKHLLLGELDP